MCSFLVWICSPFPFYLFPAFSECKYLPSSLQSPKCWFFFYNFSSDTTFHTPQLQWEDLKASWNSQRLYIGQFSVCSSNNQAHNSEKWSDPLLFLSIKMSRTGTTHRLYSCGSELFLALSFHHRFWVKFCFRNALQLSISFWFLFYFWGKWGGVGFRRWFFSEARKCLE